MRLNRLEQYCMYAVPHSSACTCGYTMGLLSFVLYYMYMYIHVYTCSMWRTVTCWWAIWPCTWSSTVMHRISSWLHPTLWQPWRSSLYLHSFPVSFCVLPLPTLLPCLFLCSPSTYTPSLSPVSSIYLYSFPVSCVLPLPILLPCLFLCSPSTYTHSLSPVSSIYLYSFPVSCVVPLPILLPCLLCPPSTYTPSLSPVSSLYLYSFPVSCVLPLPTLLPCLLCPPSTYTPSLSPVSSLYLCVTHILEKEDKYMYNKLSHKF